ncbi:MAG: arylsulfatase [Candidatus Cyclobacteriaceae bacterium M3_2C_046]
MKIIDQITTGLVLVILVFSCQNNSGQLIESDSTRPNIVLIMSDDMGYSDIGCYGSEIETPVLDNLAANGLRFSRFYNTARCCPTRASLLTGLYPAQTGMGFMTGQEGTPGYQGEIGNQCVTIAEVLQPAGYRTYISGKWHVTHHLQDVDSLKYNWPLQRGFEKFYGTISGAGSLWDPWTLTRGNDFISPMADPEYQPEQKWYYTDAISDNAVKFIEEHLQESSGDPFFMYVAYTAAHWPMHAPDDEIALHEGKYDQGYQAIRKQRYQKLIDLGLINESWGMSAQVGQWDSLQNKDWHIRNMEVYAAMITRMDKGIGKIVNKLETAGQLDNTLILFLQDNGGCAETLNWQASSAFEELPEIRAFQPMKPTDLQTRSVPEQTREGNPVIKMSKKVIAGPDFTYHAYGPDWANVSNTPFRMYKHWVHEGGISTPLIVHWPALVQDQGEIRHQPSHLIDIMATLVDITGASYPEEYEGHAIHPLPGKSLTSVFTENAAIDREAIYFEHEGNRAIRIGPWKLVSRAYPQAGHFKRMDEIPLDQWALYNMDDDRTELNDLADTYPDKVKEMAAQWQEWAQRTNTIPKPQ